MQKKDAMLGIILFLSLIFINFASAQFYGRFSLGDFLNSVDESLIVLGMIFLIVYAVISYSLNNVFRGNKVVSGTIAFAIALLVIWGVNRSGFDYNGLFYNFFFFLPTGFIETIWPLILFGLFVIFTIRYGLVNGAGRLLTILGVLMIFLNFTGIFYEEGTSLVIGLLLFFAGLMITFRSRIRFGGRKHHYSPYAPAYSAS